MRIVVLAALVACSSSTPTPPASKPDLDPLSEAHFKAMHAAPTQGPATTRGQAIELAGGKAYLSLPEGKPPFVGVVVIHEWWGLNKNIEHWADRLATAGYAALAVDLYGGVVATTREDAQKAVQSVDDAKAHGVITAALEFLARDPRIAATKRATIGWCFGGGWSLKAALAHPELDGAIIYYGRLETDPAKLATIKARVLGIFANNDQGIPPAEVDKFNAGLEQANVPHEIHRYDADHAFANPSNPKYDEKSAGDAWRYVLAFLDKLKK